MATISEIRPSPIAGRWYSGDPQELRNSIQGYLENAQIPALPGRILGLIAPHAGHLYSGPVAAYAFKAVTGFKPEVVAILSPLHQYFPYPLVTSAHKAYGTPLGTISIDGDLMAQVNQELKAELGYGLSPVPRDGEHSLEIELPFLQCTLDEGYKLLPIMMRDQTTQVAKSLGSVLSKVLSGKSVLLVASSDLSHYYSQQQARQLDSSILEQVEAFSPDGLFKVESEGRGQACGLAPIATVLWACRGLGADQVKVLHYATSGDVTGDFSAVVGYGAAIILDTRN
jgi:AmmeMemoRadiSam system protein B